VTSTLTLSRPAQASSLALDFEALYRSARDDVFAYVGSLIRDRSAAEDVTALAFERAFRKHRSYDPRKGTPRAWVFGIARNAALDELRRSKRQATLAADPEDASAQSTEDQADALVQRAAVRAAMATLAVRDRELIALKFHAGLENAEIADVLGTSPSNAGTMLHRAMTKLREALDAH
jgi:RNA polymerase sigma-70 factor (ECF subfamily)